ILKSVLDRNLQIGESCCELGKNVFCTFSSGALTRGRRNINPAVAENSVEERWVFLVECVIKKRDVFFVVVHIFLLVGVFLIGVANRPRLEDERLPSPPSCELPLPLSSVLKVNSSSPSSAGKPASDMGRDYVKEEQIDIGQERDFATA